MKISLSIIVFIIFVTTLSAQKIQLGKGSNQERVTNISERGFDISLRINSLNYKMVKTLSGKFYSLGISGCSHNLDYGNPALPVYKRLMELPKGAHYTITVLKKISHKVVLSNYGINNLLMPVQLSVPKIEHPDMAFQFNKQTYKKNEYYSKKLVQIIPLGTMRATSIARIEISPISYNPVINALEVIDQLKIRITIDAYDAQKLARDKQRFYSSYFQGDSQQLINGKAYDNPVKRIIATTNSFPLKYVIVADTLFRKSLQPFIRWKEKQGYKIIEAYLQDTLVGNTKGAIKNYLKGLYNSATANDPAPTYVLFVGDVAQLPTWNGVNGNNATDLYYCEYTNDMFPEVMYGRFSANDTAELNTQINKTIEYETTTFPNSNYLANTVLIAGADASHGATYGDGQVNYGTNNYFNAGNATTCYAYLYVNGSGNRDLEIRQKINSGVSIANYTAHGSPLGWANPSFNVSNVANMTNKDQYPLMVGNACLTNKYTDAVCFGEALLRAKDKGAIGYIGASNNTYWDEDFYWAVGFGAISANPSYATTGSGLYDLIFHTHNEAFTNWAMSSYQYIKAGNMAVTQGGSNVLYYWEIYNLMGDPSLMAYQRIPDPIQVNYIPFIQPGWTTYSVNTVPHALVALSQNDTLIASAIADSTGMAQLQFSAFNRTGVLDLVITAQNKKTYFGNVFTGTPTGPYLIANPIEINDSLNGNANSMADFGEHIKLNTTFCNLTQHIAGDATAVLHINDSELVVTDSVLPLGAITAYDTVLYRNGFGINIKPNAIDQHRIVGNIEITDTSGGHWNSNLFFVIYAPNIKVAYSVVDDSSTGNNNGIIEAGENVIIKVLVKNTGSRNALNVVCNLLSSSNRATVSGNFTIDTLRAHSMVWASFPVYFASTLNNGSFLPFTFDASSGSYHLQKDFPQLIGEVDEDFETGNLLKFDWKTSNNNPWVMDTLVKYQGNYSARSSRNISDSDTSSLAITMRILGKDTLSFYRKISTEEGYDKLHFYIDDVEQESWSGSKNWQKSSFAVSAGMHTFKWSYTKDVYGTSYMDACWIDNIKFPITDALSGISKHVDLRKFAVRLWPNPSSDFIHIDFMLKNPAEVKARLFNQLGQAVSTSRNYGKHPKGANDIGFDISKLSAGLYFVELQIGTSVSYAKFIVK